MAIRPILKIDNPDEKKILKSKAVRVKQFDKGLQTLVNDMLETMREANGVGLAAPQIGVLRRVVVIEEPAIEEEQEDGTLLETRPSRVFVMINPEVVEASSETTPMFEGCLSLPGWYGDIPRATWVTLRYQDINGKEHRIRKAEAKAYQVGHIAQHEIDHLDGVLFTERIENLSTLRNLDEEARAKRRRRPLFARRKAEAPLPE